MKKLYITLISLALVPMAALAAPESAGSDEVELAATTLEVVGETEFAPVAEGAEIIITEELESEDFSAFETPESDKAQEAIEEAASN